MGILLSPRYPWHTELGIYTADTEAGEKDEAHRF